LRSLTASRLNSSPKRRFLFAIEHLLAYLKIGR
jgi:hypothetical protein